MRRLLIWGAGDQGTVTMDCAAAMGRYSWIDFLDIKEKGHRQIPGHMIYEESNVTLEEFLIGYDEVIVATGSNDLREAKILQLNAMGIPLATLIHPTAVISPSARISGGCTILATAVVNPNARVGTGCIVNTGAVIEHDCVVEDYVNICPRAVMAGHTVVGSKSFLGTGCAVIDDIRIGRDTVIGAGAVVIHDVPDSAVVAGVPAKPIRRSIIPSSL